MNRHKCEGSPIVLNNCSAVWCCSNLYIICTYKFEARPITYLISDLRSDIKKISDLRSDIKKISDLWLAQVWYLTDNAWLGVHYCGLIPLKMSAKPTPYLPCSSHNLKWLHQGGQVAIGNTRTVCSFHEPVAEQKMEAKFSNSFCSLRETVALQLFGMTTFRKYTISECSVEFKYRCLRRMLPWSLSTFLSICKIYYSQYYKTKCKLCTTVNDVSACLYAKWH